MLQSHVPELAGELAARLCGAAVGRVTKASFCSSGSEGVEAAIKFSRAFTRRNVLLYCDGAFHGLTCGALSLMGSDFWKEVPGPDPSGKSTRVESSSPPPSAPIRKSFKLIYSPSETVPLQTEYNGSTS